MGVREAQQRIAADEFAEWMAFSQIEPFGDEWRQVGVASWAAIAAMGGAAKCKPDDFMPPVIKARRRQSNDEIIRRLQGWTAMYGVKPSGHNRNP